MSYEDVSPRIRISRVHSIRHAAYTLGAGDYTIEYLGALMVPEPAGSRWPGCTLPPQVILSE